MLNFTVIDLTNIHTYPSFQIWHGILGEAVVGDGNARIVRFCNGSLLFDKRSFKD